MLFLYLYLPLIGISHDDASALLVILSNAHFCHIFRPFDPQRLINLVLLRIVQNMRSQSHHIYEPHFESHNAETLRITDCYHRQAVAVPAKSPLHMETTLMGEACDNVLDGAS